MTDLHLIYRLLARPWTHDELDERLTAANMRGTHDVDAQDLCERPLGCLATAIPRLISLAVAIDAIQLLSATSDVGRTALLETLIDTIDRTSAGGLRRCQLALELDATAAGYQPDEYVATVRELAADLLERVVAFPESRSVAGHAQEAGRWVAIAIDRLDLGDHQAFAEAVADCLGRLLVVCVFADATAGRLTDTTSHR